MREPWLADVAERIDQFHSRASRGQAYRECWRKDRFYSQIEADREAAQVQMINERRGDGEPRIHVYRCLWEHLGRHWHLGHESRKYSQEREEQSA